MAEDSAQRRAAVGASEPPQPFETGTTGRPAEEARHSGDTYRREIVQIRTALAVMDVRVTVADGLRELSGYLIGGEVHAVDLTSHAEKCARHAYVARNELAGLEDLATVDTVRYGLVETAFRRGILSSVLPLGSRAGVAMRHQLRELDKHMAVLATAILTPPMTAGGAQTYGLIASVASWLGARLVVRVAGSLLRPFRRQVAATSTAVLPSATSYLVGRCVYRVYRSSYREQQENARL